MNLNQCDYLTVFRCIFASTQDTKWTLKTTVKILSYVHSIIASVLPAFYIIDTL